MIKDNGLILFLADLYIDGKSLKSIARLMDMLPSELNHLLLVKLRRIDENKYDQVLRRMRSYDVNLSEEDESRILESFNMLINGESIEAIADEQKATKRKVLNDLTARLLLLHKSKPKLVTEEMVNEVAKRTLRKEV